MTANTVNLTRSGVTEETSLLGCLLRMIKVRLAEVRRPTLDVDTAFHGLGSWAESKENKLSTEQVTHCLLPLEAM